MVYICYSVTEAGDGSDEEDEEEEVKGGVEQMHEVFDMMGYTLQAREGERYGSHLLLLCVLILHYCLNNSRLSLVEY